MTPQEKDLITQLLDRLKAAGPQPKDPEAEALIKAAVAAQPDAAYLLVQTALIQNMTLENAQARISELERDVAQAKEAAAKPPTSFLGGLLGGRSTPPPQAAQPMAPRGSVPQSGYVQQPMQMQPQQPPGYAQGPTAQAAPGGGGSFLRTAAMAAAGVAGGALLYQGISSMFSGGHGAGGIGGGGSQGFLGGGSQQGAAASPWGNPQGAADASGGRANNDLTAESNPDYGTSASSSDYQSSDTSDSGDSGDYGGGGYDDDTSGGGFSSDE